MWHPRRKNLSKTRTWPISKKRKSFNTHLKKLLTTYNKGSHQKIYLKPIYKLWLKPTSQGILVQISDL
jgi:hypothetical protein